MKRTIILFLSFALFPIESFSEPRPCYGMNATACEVFYLTNAEREREGLTTYQFCHECFAMAQEQSEDMFTHKYFGHDRPAGDRAAENFSERAKRFNLSHSVGENIAQAQSPARALELWMNSEGHRENILAKKFGKFAVGFSEGFYTQVFSRDSKSRD